MSLPLPVVIFSTLVSVSLHTICHAEIINCIATALTIDDVIECIGNGEGVICACAADVDLGHIQIAIVTNTYAIDCYISSISISTTARQRDIAAGTGDINDIGAAIAINRIITTISDEEGIVAATCEDIFNAG